MAHNLQHLPVWRYDTTIHKWTSANPSTLHSRRTRRQQVLRVITYNIWFDRQHQPLRFQHLCAILQRSQAHIICLQEMTKEILQQLTFQPWVRHRYWLSDIDGRTFVNGPQTYGVLMLIDKSLNLRQLLSFPFHTTQGRHLLFAQIQLRTEAVLVGTVHLESKRKEEDFRLHQLQTCQSVFDRYAMNRSDVTRLLMGDFNFDAHWPENAVQMNILPNWNDLWPMLKGSNNPGNTFKNCRYDRIMFHSSRVNPVQIRIIGNRPIGQYSKKQIDSTNRFYSTLPFDEQQQHKADIFPSDHFGLMADFDLSHV